ncbi:MAG TPA: GntG family PLP-dependent aldolase [Gaiellaceae bacterium]|nr:GntG family PLP-dependent aldolase [Gaiellaceae bacterium]
MWQSEGNPIRWLERPEIDFRWEVSAAPTRAMWEAMQSVSIGMADFGEDAAVNELEALGAELTGHEAAFLVPTVTSGTVLSLLSGAPRGTVVLMEERCHLYWVEELHVSYICGATPRLVRGDKFGAISIEALEEAFAHQYYGHPSRISLVALENTHNICGGTLLTPGYMDEVSAFCRDRGARLYVDGARIFNAAVALGVPASELTRQADFVVVGLNKGLGAPFGSLLCGSAEFVAEARVNCRRLGSMGMHKAGIYAAACLVGLRTMVDRLADDQRRARELAEAVAQVPGLAVDLETVQTNLVRVDVTEPGVTAQDVALGLGERGIAVHSFERTAFKFALHFEIDDDDVARAIEETTDVMRSLAAAEAGVARPVGSR